jgi:hypothetical protein
MSRHYQSEQETSSPFVVRPKGAWVSWAMIGSLLVGGFSAGICAANINNRLTSLEARITAMQETQVAMQKDISWLVHENRTGGSRDGGPVISKNP